MSRIYKKRAVCRVCGRVISVVAGTGRLREHSHPSGPNCEGGGATACEPRPRAAPTAAETRRRLEAFKDKALSLYPCLENDWKRINGE